MGTLYETIASLCNERGITGGKMCNDLGLSRGMMTDLKMGRKKSLSAETAQKIAEYFEVSVGHLLGNEQKEKTPILTKKDERDIAKKLDEMLGQLGGSDEALMFDGEPLDDETRELLHASLKSQLEMTKRMAKQKYTPKKYRG